MNTSTVWGSVRGVAKPSVKIDDPVMAKAARRGCTPTAQSMAA